jgi:zinc protease
VRLLSSLLLLAAVATAQIRVVQLPGKSPLVTFRFVFTTGAASDPADKPGLAALTAMMLAEGGTKDLTYKQISDAMFPMASSFSFQIDKEMTAFIGETHVDNLAEYYKLFRARLLEPGWREEDFTRNSPRKSSTPIFMPATATAITITEPSVPSKSSRSTI